MKCLGYLYNKIMKKLLTLILITPLLNAEQEEYTCTRPGFGELPFIINENRKTMDFAGIVFKYDWTKNDYGYSAKNKTSKKKITGMQSNNFYTIQWFKSNKVVLSKRLDEIPFTCKAVT